ncbi:MAG: RNA repair transcriptional activator RtcR [Planctomycetaceae bacterium]|nr:RNA repair transcriptional activator RtcR [Planctomycetaceae bacterium]
MARQNVVIGLVGTRIDQSPRRSRWDRWRPTVAVCRQEDFLVDRFELLYPSSHTTLAKALQQDIHSCSPETNVILHPVDFDDPWDFEEVFGTLHDFTRRYPFDTEQNDYFIHVTTGSHVQQICLFLLTESRHLPGVLLQTSPPRGKTQTHDAGTLSTIDLNLARYDALANRFASEQREAQQVLKCGIETRNHAFNQLIERIERVALASKAPLLITGPTGAGKTQLARQIYELKRRREQFTGPLVEVNCATLRGDQAMSALFGHSKGAFTGAASARSGLLKRAHGGLLFLDEIGELGSDEQALLLRAIEEQRFLPVGSDEEVEVEFQLIAGTNRNLADDVAAGTFREDLLARINLWSFRLPGLAERREDIAPNLDFELDRASDSLERRVRMTAEARSEFLQWAESPHAGWPGNFRDLSACVTRMATLSDSGRISEDCVREEIQHLATQWPSAASGDDVSTIERLLGEGAAARLDLFDAAQLAAVIRCCRRHTSLAAAGRELFAVSRAARSSSNDSDRLRKYLQRFDIAWADLKDG